MPNYIKNRIELIGDEIAINELFYDFSTRIEEVQNTSFDGDLTYEKDGCYGWLNTETNIFKRRNKEDVNGVPDGWKPLISEAWTRFPDFNKIVPMPESLSIQIHSGIETAVEVALKMDYSDHPLLSRMEKVNRERFQSPLDFDENDFELYIKALRNVKEHGFIYWYDWSKENWGVKWNSSECEQKDNVFTFETAWSGVPNLIKIMHEKHPNVKIIYEFSDEDTGCNCGIGIYENGNSNFRKLDNSSIEAYELAFKLRPEYKENYVLENGEYQYREED